MKNLSIESRELAGNRGDGPALAHPESRLQPPACQVHSQEQPRVLTSPRTYAAGYDGVLTEG